MRTKFIIALLIFKLAGYHQQAGTRINNELVHTQEQSVLVSRGMPIPWRFSFLGNSVNRGIAICHSSGIGETKTYSPGYVFGVRGISGTILFQI